MNIPEKYRERYDRLAMNHPWMREMRDETNGTDGETNGINDEITLPEGDAVSILRRAADSDTPMVSLCDRFDAAPLLPSEHSRVFGQLADMVERDYVSREMYDSERKRLLDKLVAADDAFIELKRCRCPHYHADENYCDAHETRFKKLYEQVRELTAERDEAVEAYDKHMAAHDAWHEPEDIKHTRNRFSVLEKALNERIAKLEAERDELKAMNDRLQVALDAVEGCDERCKKLEAERDEALEIRDKACGDAAGFKAERDEWKTKCDISEVAYKQADAERKRYSEQIDELQAERDEWKAKAEGFTEALEKLGCSVLANGTVFGPTEVKSAKRAAEVERLMKCYPSGYFNVLRDAFGWEHGSSHSDKEWRDALIDLLADEPMDAQRDSNGTCPDGDRTCPNDGLPPEIDVSAKSVDANDGNATCNNSGENVTHDSRENLGSEPSTLEDFEGKGSEVDSREKLEADIWAGCEHLTTVGCGDLFVNVPWKRLLEWLDRMDAIKERECKNDREALDYYSDRYAEMDAEIVELRAEADYWKQEVQNCLDCAYPQSHSPERRYDPNVMGYPDRENCTTPSTLVCAVIDGIRDESCEQYLALFDEAHRLECENRNLAVDLSECMEAKGKLEDELRAVKRHLKQEQGMHSVTLNNWEQAKGKLTRERESLQHWKEKLDERDARAVEEIAAEQVAQYREKAEYWKARAEESWERLSAVKEAVAGVVDDMRALV